MHRVSSITFIMKMILNTLRFVSRERVQFLFGNAYVSQSLRYWNTIGAFSRKIKRTYVFILS